ncbi:hypothetical protein BRD15_02760 [Halobacteriales archaeon SW_6_65_15]|nr:MAG: hypothetical protein BRD15_02760 [Halobacteriales archaeon SW_6_65_15]
MFVNLKQYKHEEVQFDDNRTTGESQTEDTVDKDAEEYFGEDMDEFDAETWETGEYEDDPIQQRYVTISGVTAVSVPQEPTDEDDSDLPGRTIQLRTGGGIEHLEQAEIVEVQDDNPQGSEPKGKVSVDDEPQGSASTDEDA